MTPRDDALRLLREAIAYAPSRGTPTATGLVGIVTADGHYVCAKCAGRLIARGFGHLLRGEPRWNDQPVSTAPCVTCQEDV